MAEAPGKAAMLARIRRSLAVEGSERQRNEAVAQRLSRHPANLVPSRAKVSGAEQLRLFRKMAEAVETTVEHAGSAAELPKLVSQYLRSRNLPQQVRHGEDPLLKELPWKKQAPSLEVTTGCAEPSDEVSLSHAFAGVAETGTLVLLSGTDNPTTLNFLPETHIVILEAKDVAGSYEDVWQRLRERSPGKGNVMPRTVNMITGPSRTADIEQKIELGAHGPRRLHVIILDRK